MFRFFQAFPALVALFLLFVNRRQMVSRPFATENSHIVISKLQQQNMNVHLAPVKEVQWRDIYQQRNTNFVDDPLQKLKAFMKNYTKTYPRIPLVIRHDNHSFIAKAWNILSKWKPKYFRYGPKVARRTLGSFEIYSQKHRVFKTFHDNKPFEAYLSNKSLHFEDFNTMKLVRSFSEFIFDDDTFYSYYAEKIEYLNHYFDGLMADISPYKEWIEESVNTKWSVNDLEMLIKVRFSNQNQETFMHFDAVWNDFIQVYGKKMFILSSPNNVMYTYPVLHPHSGHSQLNHVWNWTNYEKEQQKCKGFYAHFGMDIVEELKCHFVGYECERSEDIHLQIVELNPGDMLLIPPYWWHHVVGVEKSISLHFWLNSDEYLLANRDIYSLPIPFERDWSLSLKIVLLRAFVKMILESMHKEFEIGDSVHLDLLVLRQLYHLRYESLMIRNELVFDERIKNDVSHVCNKNEQLKRLYTEDANAFFTNLEIRKQDRLLVARMLKMGVTDERIGEKLHTKYEHVCKEIAKIFKSIKERSLQLLLVKNYIEYILNGVLGPDHIAPFLQFCCNDLRLQFSFEDD